MTDQLATSPDFKRCSMCDAVKSTSAFHRDRTRRDGLAYRCKSCHATLRTPRDPQKTPRERWRAYDAVYRAVRAGQLVRPPTCQRCDYRCVTQAHHADYSRPLDVEWLCASCHKTLHRQQQT